MLGTARVWSGVVKEQYVCFQAAIIQGVLEPMAGFTHAVQTEATCL